MGDSKEQRFRGRGPIQESTWGSPLCQNYDTSNISFHGKIPDGRYMLRRSGTDRGSGNSSGDNRKDFLY